MTKSKHLQKEKSPQRTVNNSKQNNQAVANHGALKTKKTSTIQHEAFDRAAYLESDEKGFLQSSNWVALLVTMTVCAVYLTTIHESLPGGDSGELIIAAYEFGVAHPPGYPLYTLLAQFFIYILPFGNVAWRVNLMTVMCGAFSAGAFYVLIFSVTKNQTAGFLGAGILAFSRLFWFWSMSAEVFSLNNLLLSLLMLTSVKLVLSSRCEMVTVSSCGSFLCGLCLSNQHTSVLYIIFLVPWAFVLLIKQKVLSIYLLFALSFAFMLGLLPYLYLPVSSIMHKARWTWGDQSSFSGFLHHLLRKEYGTWELGYEYSHKDYWSGYEYSCNRIQNGLTPTTNLSIKLKDHEGQGFVSGLGAYMNHVTVDLSMPVIFLCAFTPLTVVKMWNSKIGGVIQTFFLMLIFYLCFFAWRANLDISRPLFFKVVERFWMQADLILIFMAALSYSSIITILNKTCGLQNKFIELLIVIPLITAQAYKWWPLCNQSGNFVIENFALQSLNAFPNGSIILTKGDLPSNSYRYFHLCENVRPDLEVFDQEVLTYEWSLPMMKQFYPGIRFPGDLLHLKAGFMKDGRKSFTFKDLIDSNIERRPIFACIGMQDHEPSWKSTYALWPFGVCWKVVKKDAVLDIKTFTKETKHFAENWPHGWIESRANDGSWENVANSEMWRAKTATALFYLELATPMEEGSATSKKLLLEAYKLYTAAIEEHPSFPSYWHRNYAITCEKLTRAKTSLKQVDLLQKTVVHFNHFIKSNPNDADVTKIRGAIKTLQEYLASTSKT